VPVNRQTRSRTIAQKAWAYDMACLQVDGNDVLAVYAACKEAAERARRDRLPTLIECVTYRLSLHTTVDDPTKYRSAREVEEWEKREPLLRLQRHLERTGLLTAEQRDALERSIAEQIRTAVRAAFERSRTFDDPTVIFDHLYAEMPPYLREQRSRFRAEQLETKRGGATPPTKESVGQRPMEG
jgi:TPP-dependent pyruvate/acetoin dehydrogenase alpha subunit